MEGKEFKEICDVDAYKKCRRDFCLQLWELMSDDGLHPLAITLPSGERVQRSEYQDGVNAGKLEWQQKLFDFIRELTKLKIKG